MQEFAVVPELEDMELMLKHQNRIAKMFRLQPKRNMHTDVPIPGI